MIFLVFNIQDNLVKVWTGNEDVDRTIFDVSHIDSRGEAVVVYARERDIVGNNMECARFAKLYTSIIYE